MEQLFNQIVAKDLQKMNELVQKGWYGTTDFNETNEDYTKGERISETRLARGA